MKSKIVFLIFSENFSYGVSLLASLARRCDWDSDIFYVEPGVEPEKILTSISCLRPNRIALSFNSLERQQAFAVAQCLSVLGIPMMAGGIHPSVMPHDVINSGLFNTVVRGDGLGVLEHILKAAPESTRGLIEGARNPHRAAYTELVFSDSQIIRMRETGVASTMTSYGCPFSCTFCRSGSAQFFLFEPRDVFNNILKLHRECGVRVLRIYDDIFAYSFERLHEFRRMFESEGKPVAIDFLHARSDLFTPEIAGELVALGASGVHFGIESASPRILEFLDKRECVEDTVRASNICREAGLSVVLFLMHGIPTQTREDYEMNIELMDRIKPDSIQTPYLCPYPGTKMFDYCFEHNLMPDDASKDNFDWFHPGRSGNMELQLPLKSVDYELAEQYRLKALSRLPGDDVVFQKMQVVDQRPWVFAGGGESYYFRSLLKKFSRTTWKNCLGYLNIDKQASFAVRNDSEISIPEFDPAKQDRPFWVATCYPFGAYLDSIVTPFVAQSVGRSHTPIISISTYRTAHSPQEIIKIMNERSGR